MIEFFQELIRTFIEFLYAPLIFPKMFWILAPVALAILIMELYFWQYPRWSIDYHKSMENTIFLVFISFDLLRYVEMEQTYNTVKFFVCIAFIIFTIAIAFLDFYHKIPISAFAKLSFKFVIAYISYVLVVLTYSDMLASPNILTFIYILLSSVFLFLIILLVRNIFAVLEPKSFEELDSFLQVIETDLKKTINEADNKTLPKKEAKISDNKEKKHQPK